MTAVHITQTPARPGPVEAGSWKAGGPVSDRAGALTPRSGAVSPTLPKPFGPPRFGDGPPHPMPGPRPNPPPVPMPPPPIAS